VASPTIEAITTNSGGSNTSAVVDWTAGVQANDLLIAIITTDDDDTKPVDWTGTSFTEIFSEEFNTYGPSCYIGYKQATGGETSITVTLNGSEEWATIGYRISGAENPATQPPETAPVNTDRSAIVSYNALTPTGGSNDYLFIAVHGVDAARSTTGWPSGYSNTTEVVKIFAITACSSSVAKTTASETPGNATTAQSDQWISTVIAVHPSSAEGAAEEDAVFFGTDF